MKKNRDRSIFWFFRKIKIARLFSFVVLIFLFFLISGAEAVLAAGTSPSLNPLKDSVESFPELIQMILEDIVIPVGGIVATFAIVYSGFLFVTAQGNPEKLTKARSAFIWAVIGGLVILGSWAIAQAIEATVDEITAMAYFF
ncbi:MAG: hypothetical protein ACQESA_02785 [Patescibacteria group bacterium]